MPLRKWERIFSEEELLTMLERELNEATGGVMETSCHRLVYAISELINIKLSMKTPNEFPEGKENYCPICYFEDDKVILRIDCRHYEEKAT